MPSGGCCWKDRLGGWGLGWTWETGQRGLLVQEEWCGWMLWTGLRGAEEGQWWAISRCFEGLAYVEEEVRFRSVGGGLRVLGTRWS